MLLFNSAAWFMHPGWGCLCGPAAPVLCSGSHVGHCMGQHRETTSSHGTSPTALGMHWAKECLEMRSKLKKKIQFRPPRSCAKSGGGRGGGLAQVIALSVTRANMWVSPVSVEFAPHFEVSLVVDMQALRQAQPLAQLSNLFPACKGGSILI